MCEETNENTKKKKKKVAVYDPLGISEIFGVEEEVDYSEESEDEEGPVF